MYKLLKVANRMNGFIVQETPRRAVPHRTVDLVKLAAMWCHLDQHKVVGLDVVKSDQVVY